MVCAFGVGAEFVEGAEAGEEVALACLRQRPTGGLIGREHSVQGLAYLVTHHLTLSLL